jgi:ATP phosphoribosyltransferase
MKIQKQSCSVLGIGRSTLDTIFRVDARTKSEMWRELKADDEEDVVFESDIAKLCELETQLKQRFQWTSYPGGNVANACAHLATSWNTSKTNNTVTFACHSSYGFDATSLSTFDALRLRNITCRSGETKEIDRKSICLVDQVNGQKLGIITTRDQGPINHSLLDDKYDILMAAANELTESPELFSSPSCRGKDLALLITDSRPLSSFVPGNIAISMFRRCYMFGSRTELASALGISPDHPTPPALDQYEIVVTDGSRPICVKEFNSGRFLSYPSLSHELSEPMSNALGAGDAFAGGYLSARITGHPIHPSVAAGSEAALRARNCHHAQGAPELDLNRVFGYKIDRSSAGVDDGALYSRIRRSPGLVIISCGQTGVDQIGMRVANRLGFPAYSILPAGRRTEFTEGLCSEPDDFAGSTCFELKSASYRFCTWTNVYFSDGTIIFDRAGTEGSEETRKACRSLGRPFLDIADKKDSVEIASIVVNWIRKHDIRVINIAGNRYRFLSATERSDAETQIERHLVVAAWAREQLNRKESIRTISIPQIIDHSYGGLKVLAPKQEGVRKIVEKFLLETHGAKTHDSKRLAVSYPSLNLHVFYLKSRDIPDFIASGDGDLGISGSDMLVEAQRPELQILLQTGLHPCCLVSLTRPGIREINRIASQYPSVAKSYCKNLRIPTDSVHAIQGAAEAFPYFSDCDAVVDTLRSGNSADTNELVIRDMLGSTSLALFSPRTTPTSGRASNFATAFREWLLLGKQDNLPSIEP